MIRWLQMPHDAHISKKEFEVAYCSWEAVNQEVTPSVFELCVQVISQKLKVDLICYFGVMIVVFLDRVCSPQRYLLPLLGSQKVPHRHMFDAKVLG